MRENRLRARSLDSDRELRLEASIISVDTTKERPVWRWFARAEPNGRTRKPVDAITPADAADFPVWEYANDEEGLPGRDETWMRPLLGLPVSSMDNRVAWVTVRLANGETRLGALSNVDLNDPSEHEHFLCISVFRDDGDQFFLARYHDPFRDTHGPRNLAEFLGLRVEDIFPIAFDLSSVATGNPACLHGTIEREPKNPQSRRDLMKHIAQRSHP